MNQSPFQNQTLSGFTPVVEPASSPAEFRQERNGSSQDKEESADQPDSSKMNSADFYHLIRGQIQSEDNLVNQRLIWLVFSQSFMFSAFAAILNAPEKPKPMFGDSQALLVWLIPSVAILAVVLVYIGILSSMMVLSNLRHRYDKFPEDSSTEHFPPIQGMVFNRMLASLAPSLLPLVFMGTWIFILVHQYIFTLVSS